MCGEQFLPLNPLSFVLGSPPRVRGTVFAEVGVIAFCGITPACAGNSIGTDENAEIIRDHPRVCGEQVPPPVMVWLVLGSPPRVRGTA